MKKALLFCFISLLISLNVVAQENYPGQVCESAIPITNFPFITTDNTSNYGDDYNGSPGSSGCGASGSYLNGDDVVYAFTATDNVAVTITMTPTAGWSSIFIYNSCANIGVSCIANAFGPTSNPRVIVLPVTTGQTYYVVISTAAFSTNSQSIGYNLTVVKNSCTNFISTFAMVPDCANGNQFFATANVTNMGTATSITANSNQGGTSQTITAPGVIQFGPYPNGTNVILNLQNDDDPNCFSNSPNLTNICPATNNLCSDAILVTCGNVEIQTTIGATIAGEPFFCQAGPGAGGLWYKFIGTGDVATFSLCGSTYNTKIQILTGSCGDFTCIAGNDNFCNLQSEVTFITTLGMVYYVYVYGATGSQGVFTLTTSCAPIPTPPINDNCINATIAPINTDLSCTVVTSGTILGATQSPSPQAGTCVGIPNDDVWYQFVATQSIHTISLLNVIGSTTNLNHVIYTSTNTTDACTNLTFVFCSNPNDSYVPNLVAGQTYFIRIYSNGPEELQNTTFDLCVSSPKLPITTNTSQYTVPELINEVLINSACATASNISWSTGTNYGSTNGIGYFEKGESEFPFVNGIVLVTGDALNVPGPNLNNNSSGSWPGDTDLNSIISNGNGQPMNSQDATKIEFEFIPLVNQFNFNFIFASEEYATYQCGFSDAFAFLLTNLTTSTTSNLAVVPGTTSPISVLTIRNQLYNSGCSSVNPEYFAFFYGTGGIDPLNAPINFNGVTVPMTASSAVIPNNLYKLKMVIADQNDSAFNSAVFIEGNSFGSSYQCQSVIQLEAFVDANNNGTKEPTEIAYSQGTFNYTLNNSTQTNVNYSPSGILFVPVDNTTNTFNFSYQVYPELASYFNCTTLHSNITFNPTGNNTYYFPIANTLPYNDVEVSLTATAGPNPGFSYSNKITYKNNGLTAASGTLTYEKNSVLTINTISQTGTVASTNGFTYAFSNLAPNETRTITIGLQTPTIPTVALGDLLTNIVSSTTTGDINATNNAAELTQTVIGSYDPNDKMEAQGPEILFSSFGADDYLYYTIRFQNTGTANAETVVITDLLSADLDEQSIRMISASHDYTMNRIGNDLEWTFEAINLVPTIVNEVASQGYVHFKIKPKPGYMVGDIIPNTAQIYFDFNAPIITNTFETEFVATLGVADFTTDNLIVYPNPSTNQVSISVQNSTDAIAEIRLTDMLGKVVFQQKGTHTQTTIDLSGLSNGVYMLEVQSENKFSVVKKLVKN
jgi:uncharacterized repeat protein (TIGR01451 family)